MIPGAEVHGDPDITWAVSPGSIWSNVGVMVRFTPNSAARRLDALIDRYSRHGRGMGLWITAASTPANLPELLRARDLRCRKYFPAMLRDLTQTGASQVRPPDLECRRVEDMAEFEKTAHPSIGPLTTPLRRERFAALRALAADPSRRILGFVAWLGGKPVGASLLYLGRETSGLHGLDVLEEYQGRGIGSALLEHTCREAAARGASSMALLATSEGERVYQRCAFQEVARFGYWFRSFQR